MPFLMVLSLKEGHDVATVSSCYCSFVHSVLFFFVFVEFIICHLIFLRCEENLGHLSYFILADYFFLFIEKNPLMIVLSPSLPLFHLVLVIFPAVEVAQRCLPIVNVKIR